MKKLLLIEDLTVESFETSVPAQLRGTVRANDHSAPSNCIESGYCSCEGYPCDTYTCRCTDFPTCPFSCGQSCPNTCDSCQATCISCIQTCEGYAGCSAPNICIE